MAIRVYQTVITKFLVLASVAVIQIGVISAQTEGNDEKLAVPLSIPLHFLKNPCLLIKCPTRFFCKVVNAESCCKANKICALCIPCPSVFCPEGCNVVSLLNGCLGCKHPGTNIDCNIH